MKLLRIVILIMLLSTYSFADSTSYCDFPFSIFYCSETGKIYLSCTDASSSDLITINPVSLVEETRFVLDCDVDMIFSVDGGANLLLLLSSLDGDPMTHDGVLKKVNSQTGELIPGFEIQFDRIPLTMVVDNTQDYAYVSIGLHYSPCTIYKINLSTFQVVSPQVHFGELANDMALSNDGTKLYVRSDAVFYDEQPVDYFKIGVINTVDMTEGTPIKIHNITPAFLEMGYDNRLFVSNPIAMVDDNTDVSLIVIDTITDEIVEEVSLNEMGIWDLKIDLINQKLYGAVWPRDYYDPIVEFMTNAPSPEIVQFDLTDPTYTPSYFTLANEDLWLITVASMSGFSRIFAIPESDDSKLVYYMDL